MAKATNALTQGISGKVSGLVFRRNANGTISVGDAPRPSSVPPSTKQLSQQRKFKGGAYYAKGALQNPALLAEYEAGSAEHGGNAYRVAHTDYLNAPEIQRILLSEYNGKAGDKIHIFATDDFKVAEVRVTITNPDGTLVETGLAVQQPNVIEWLYTATKANTSLTGDVVLVEVSDLPGNLTSKSQTL